ncbi:GM24404 [Drosophila sechellia]|uniref:GM24404 n=1 Tax=Drosophila sechellia TaxID=7238 RepID=B4HJM7_DROSE|nr:GM24404 [Drosophila sechellia]
MNFTCKTLSAIQTDNGNGTRWPADSQSTRTVVAPTELSTTELNERIRTRTEINWQNKTERNTAPAIHCGGSCGTRCVRSATGVPDHPGGMLQRLQRSTSASAIRSHLTKVSSTYRRPIAFNFVRRECKRFYVLPVYMHSTKQSIRLWWQYAYKCVTPSASAGAVWNPNLKFRLYCSRQLRIRKLRRGPWSRRQPLRLHINDIKLMCQLRGRSK